MNCLLNPQVKKSLLFSVMLLTSLCLPKLSFAVAPVNAPVDLAQIPLANSTTTLIKPNVMFILDDSGSMTWEYLPDWAGSYTGIDYLHRNADFNGVAYNPAIAYEKPVLFNADSTLNTTTYPSQVGTSAATGADTSVALPNWQKVKSDAYGKITNSKDNLETSPYYYTVIPGEYCKERDLKDCIAASATSVTYPYPAPLRWCNNTTNATSAAVPTGGGLCQAINDSSHSNPRYPTPRTSTISVGGTGSGTLVGMTVSGSQIMSATTGLQGGSNNLAAAIATRINACTFVITGSCTVSGYSATVSGSTVTLNARHAASLANISVTPVLVSLSGSRTVSPSAFTKNNVPGYNLLTNISPSAASYAYPGSATKDIGRTDCAGTTCTGLEEMINYANWYTYYHTRMQAMKTSVSRAFKSIDHRYRVGFTTINNSTYTDSEDFQHIDTFELGQKNSWYTKLFDTDTPASTPLRSALSKVGRLYAHKLAGAADPVQYSCQQNFAILSTDGYWNTDTNADVKNLTGGQVGNQDGPSATATATYKRPFWEGPTASSNTLADVASYYYKTDLRTPTLSNCTSGATGNTLCSTFAAPLTDDPYNNVFTNSNDPNTFQHMVTFTMGLGVDGTISYTANYDDETSGEYYRLKKGTAPIVNWPVPLENTQTAVDDLWHAAVNGKGMYFSAKKPNEIIDGFAKGLSSISAKLGSGAAAATSTLNPVAGDNFAYVASYTTNSWTGNLEARRINTTNGVVSETASWCVEDVIGGTCSTAPVLDNSGGGNVYNCVTGGVSVEMPKACDGRMNVPGLITATTDGRKIWTKGASAASLNNFNLASGDLNAADFNATKLAGLSQWSINPHNGVPFTTAQQTAAVNNIVGYLRGQTGFEDRASNLTGSGSTTVDNRLFRAREATLGDAVESQPAYLGKATFSYLDAGYSAFKAAQASRAGTVYMGANDGMLHAFDANSGDERWAFVPSMVIPNMFALADTNYSSKHSYYVNGSPVISDIYDGGTWKTILVAGLNGGGRGYYALDITNPTAPKFLWEFTPAEDADLGYTFGNPEITKKANGDWVVLVTSGYNNIPDVNPRVRFPRISTGNGKGYLYVLNAATGAKISKIGTGQGTASVPSGLSQIASYAADAEKNNTATFTYGGDLLGNVWRFDINAETVTKFAELKDVGGVAQPIMTRPELANVLTSDGKVHRIVFVGTGKYLESSDLTDTQKQTLYAIKDDDVPLGTVTPALVDPQAFSSPGPNHMVEQSLSTAGANRTATNNSVNFAVDRGWFVNFPPGGERQNVASRLVLGTLIVPTTVPSSTVCTPGGTSWLNYFNYKTGGAVDTGTGQVSTKQNAPIVGINVIYIPDPVTGKPKPVVSVVTADHPTPEVIKGTPFSSTGSGFQKKRAVWRELVQ